MKRFLKAAGISALVVGAFVVWLLTRDRAPPRPHPLALAADTTRITAPLTPTGYPDYFEALEQSASRGVTPENNAAILVLQALGCAELNGQDREEFFRRLGIPPIPENDYSVEQSKFVIAWDTFVERLPADRVPPYIEPKPALEEQPTDQGDEPTTTNSASADTNAGEPPLDLSPSEPEDLDLSERVRKGREHLQTLEDRAVWTPAELKLAAEWRAQQETPLRHLDLIEQCTHFYIPSIRASDKKPLVFTNVSQKTALRAIVIVLKMRAMEALQRGEFDESWRDVKRVLHLAKLTRETPDLISVLVSNAVHSIGCDAMRRLLGNPKLNAEQVARYLREFEQLSGLPDFAAAIDQGDRFLFLDYVRALAEVGPEGLSDRPGPASGYMNQGRMLDYDAIMRRGNEWYDRLSKVMTLKREESQPARTAYETDFNAFFKDVAPYGEALLPAVMALKSRTGLSEKMADILLALTMPSITILNDSQRKAVAYQILIRAGCALHRYRAKYGRFPEKLEALVPEFLAEPALDIYHYSPIGQPDEDYLLQYKTDGQGFLLYSYGYGGEDHGGYEVDSQNLSIYTPDFQPQPPLANSDSFE